MRGSNGIGVGACGGGGVWDDLVYGGAEERNKEGRGSGRVLSVGGGSEMRSYVKMD